MEKKSCADETASQASLTFSLHHGRILRVALLQNVNLSANDLSSVLAISRHSNPDDKSSQIGSFAVLSTKYVVSISQLLVAANMALIREYNSLAGDRDSMYQEDGSEHFFNLKEESIGKRQPRTSKHVTSDVPIGNFSNRKSLRTVAMDTIYCAGGSLNKTAVMQDMGFCGNGWFSRVAILASMEKKLCLLNILLLLTSEYSMKTPRCRKRSGRDVCDRIRLHSRAIL